VRRSGQFGKIGDPKRQDDPQQTDYGTALVEQWARIADELSAEQDAVARESYLGTKRFVWVAACIAGLGVAAVLAVVAARRWRMRCHPWQRTD
jgi:hypothetical protein